MGEVWPITPVGRPSLLTIDPATFEAELAKERRLGERRAREEASAREEAARLAAQEWRELDPLSLAGLPVPEQEWIVPGWLPTGVATLLYADGGVGKTLLGLQLMAACAAGTPWCGMAVARCRSIGLFSEDDRPELHRRMEAIRSRHGLAWSDFADMRAVDAVGQDNILVRFDRGGEMSLTPRFRQLRDRALAMGARLVIVDTAATTFGGNEIDRSQVTQFVGTALTGLARDINGAVLLNAHPSVTGINSGAMTSGSTAWSNSARMRWSLTRAMDEEGVEDADGRVLTKRKANGAGIGEPIVLRWSAGLIEPPHNTAGANSFAVVSGMLDVQRVFLDILARYPEPVSGSRNAGNFAPKMFAKRAENEGYNKRELERAMEALMAAGRVASVQYGRPSDYRFRLAVVPASEAADEATDPADG